MASDNAREHQRRRAIDRYTNSIKLQGSPPDVIAMAMYNRALVYLAVGDFTKGADDLNAVLQMEEAPASIKQTAKQKLAKREARFRETQV